MFDVIGDDELLPGGMGKRKNKKRQGRQGRQDIMQFRRGRTTRDLIPPRECGGWTNGGSTNLISSYGNGYKHLRDIVTVFDERRARHVFLFNFLWDLSTLEAEELSREVVKPMPYKSLH